MRSELGYFARSLISGLNDDVATLRLLALKFISFITGQVSTFFHYASSIASFRITKLRCTKSKDLLAT